MYTRLTIVYLFILGFIFQVKAQDCPTEMWADSNAQGCLNWSFEIGSFVEGESVTWDFGDGTEVAGGHFITHEYAQAGNYEVCGLYSNPSCEATEICTTIEALCPDECELEVEFDVIECGLIVFEAFGYSEDIVPMWYVNDSVASGGNIFTFFTEMSGDYTICVSYESDYCLETVSWCETFNIETCNDDCPQEMYAGASEENCMSWVFEIGSFVEGESVSWDFGDGTEEEGGHFADHTYTSNGEYLVCGYYTTPACPEGVEICQEIVVGCEEDCWVEIVSDQIDGNTWYFDAQSSNVDDVYWLINDTPVDYPENGIFNFEPGLHIICAGIDIETCPMGVVSCFTIEVGNCTDVAFGFDSMVDGETGPSFVGWALYNAQGFEVADGGCSYTAEQPYCDVNLCLENGCYEMVMFATGLNDGDDGFEFNAGYDGMALELFDIYYAEGGNSVSYEFSLNWDCQNAGNDCPEEMYAGQQGENCHDWEFEIGSFVAGENVIWNFGDGTIVEGGHFVEHTFEESGIYTVCGSYSSPICEGEDFCAIVEVSCEEECTEVGLAFDFMGNLENNEELSWAIIDLNGNDVVEDGMCEFNNEDPYCDAMVCLPNGCYEVVIIGSLDSLPELFAGAFIGEEQLEYTSELSACGELCWSYAFALGSECVEENEECTLDIIFDQFNGYAFNFVAAANQLDANIQWDFGDESTGEGWFQTYTFPGPGVYEVCASYVTEACPDGVEECVEVVIEDEGCTNVTFSFVSDVNQFTFQLITWALFGGDLDLDGEFWLPILNQDFEFTYCMPDGCYEFEVGVEDGVLDIANLFIEIDVEGEGVSDLEIIEGEGTATIQFGVNDDCLVSVSENEAEQITVYPIPASDQVWLQGELKLGSILEIHDVYGRLVLSEIFSDKNTVLDVSGLSKGVYVLTIDSKASKTSHTIQIMR